jgi:hypothetical protein
VKQLGARCIAASVEHDGLSNFLLSKHFLIEGGPWKGHVGIPANQSNLAASNFVSLNPVLKRVLVDFSSQILDHLTIASKTDSRVQNLAERLVGRLMLFLAVGPALVRSSRRLFVKVGRRVKAT